MSLSFDSHLLGAQAPTKATSGAEDDLRTLSALANAFFQQAPTGPANTHTHAIAPRSLHLAPSSSPVIASEQRAPLPSSAPLAQTTQNFYFYSPEQSLPASYSPHALASPSHHASSVPLALRPYSDKPAALSASLDIHALRAQFPILRELINGYPLAWLDNAATTHKPDAVISRLTHFYQHENSNIHRAAHTLAARATDAYESARESVRRFINAASSDEVLFQRGTTEAINLVAQSWGRKHVKAGDEIIISHLEHHANIVPWQLLAKETGAVLRVIPVDDSGQIILEQFQQLLNARTRIVSVTQVSNALGTITPIRELIQLARAHNVPVLVDGAQSISHIPVDVQALDADFFVFSGHKVYAPTGIGVLWAKRAILETMPPWQGGGNMIADVTFEHTTFQDLPNTFEAGTGNIADAVGLGAALDYVREIGIERIAHYEHELLLYGTERLAQVPGLRLIGTAKNKTSVMSFTLQGYETEQVGFALNQKGIAVRTGHHCAQPILRRFGVEATVRPSIAFYNTYEEIDRLIAVLHELRQQKPLRR